MSAHVVLNLLNELGKRDKMRGLPSILYLFRNEFNNQLHRSTNVRFYLSYDKYLYNFVITCYVRNVVMDVITFPVNL